jgi:hypothetical protein
VPELPQPVVLASLGGVVAVLVALHLWATHGTGTLGEPMRSRLAVTPATTLSLWWHHLWAGFFHKSWGHLAFNVAIFAAAFPFATRQMSAAATLGNALWIGPFTVFTLHLLLVLPLAGAGSAYASRALHYPLVGFSVMAYSIAGAALTLLSPSRAVLAGTIVLAGEAALALLLSTGPFVAVYHGAGFAFGYYVRTLWLRYPPA